MNHTTVLSCLLISWFLSVSAFSQKMDAEPEDKIIFGEYERYIEPFQSQSKELILQKTAEFFLGKPYAAGTMDRNETEQLVINLRGFDCVTFVETVIALANTTASKNFSFDNFASQLKRIRYRNGVLEGYDSRLHYTSDWVYNNEEKNILSSLSRRLGGVLEPKTIGFMSCHRSAYRALENDDEMLKRIKDIENEINARGGFYYLPKDKIAAVAAEIPHMAAIAFTTSIRGLDTTHTGFAYKKDGKLTFIHASSAKKEVVIEERTVSDYCQSQQSCTGIMVQAVR